MWGMSLRRCASALFFSAFALLVSAGSVRAAFGPVQSVSPPAISLTGWDSAQFRDGSALAVSFLMPVQDRFEIDVSTRRAGEPFGAPQRVSGRGDVGYQSGDGFDRPQGLASSPDGQAVVTWVERGRARVLLRRPDGTFGPVQQLSAARWSTAWMDERGDALVVYVTRSSLLRAAVRVAGAARFGPSRSLGILRGRVTTEDDFAVVKRAGGFVLAWDACVARRPALQDGRCRHHIVRASVAPAGRGPGRPQTLGPVDTSSIYIRALAGRSGDVVALWSSGRSGSVRTARLPSSSTRFGAARTISHPGLGAFSITAALGHSGGFAAWIERQHDGHLQAVGSEIDPRGRIGAPFVLSADEDAVLPSVRVEDDGAAVVYWRREHHSVFTPAPWWIRSRAPGGPFTPATELPELEGLAVALDGHGTVLALTAIDTPNRPSSGDSASCQWQVATQSGVWRAGTQPTFRTLDDCVFPRRPALAVDSSGRAIGAWVRDTAPHEQPSGRFIRVSARPPGDDFSPVTNASDSQGAQPHASLTDHDAMLLWGQDLATPPRTLRAAFDDAVP
jgi:hypothetical protein